MSAYLKTLISEKIPGVMLVTSGLCPLFINPHTEGKQADQSMVGWVLTDHHVPSLIVSYRDAILFPPIILTSRQTFYVEFPNKVSSRLLPLLPPPPTEPYLPNFDELYKSHSQKNFRKNLSQLIGQIYFPKEGSVLVPFNTLGWETPIPVTICSLDGSIIYKEDTYVAERIGIFFPLEIGDQVTIRSEADEVKFTFHIRSERPYLIHLDNRCADQESWPKDNDIDRLYGKDFQGGLIELDRIGDAIIFKEKRTSNWPAEILAYCAPIILQSGGK